MGPLMAVPLMQPQTVPLAQLLAGPGVRCAAAVLEPREGWPSG